jgi:hypothetical protein
LAWADAPPGSSVARTKNEKGHPRTQRNLKSFFIDTSVIEMLAHRMAWFVSAMQLWARRAVGIRPSQMPLDGINRPHRNGQLPPSDQKRIRNSGELGSAWSELPRRSSLPRQLTRKPGYRRAHEQTFLLQHRSFPLTIRSHFSQRSAIRG